MMASMAQPGSGTLRSVCAVCVACCVAACTPHGNTGQRARGTDASRPARPRHATASQTDASSSGVALFTSTLDNALADFDSALQNRLLVEKLLAVKLTGDIVYADVSNTVAHISSRELLDCLHGQLEDFDESNPKTLMIMCIYEIIYRRGEPSWATAYAISELGDFYCQSSMRDKHWWVMREQLARPVPAADATEAEKATYASIQLSLELRMFGERRLQQIEKIFALARAGVVPFPRQALDMTEVSKALALLQAGRYEESRQHFHEIYRRCQRGEMDDSVTSLFPHGPDAEYERRYRLHCANLANGSLARTLAEQERNLVQ
ncbi:MAG: hypothetical protein N2595_07790 [bacterium]|nr:hypothetical protein [bacterium]